MDSVVSLSFLLKAHMAQGSLRRPEFVDSVTGSPTIHTEGSPSADYVHRHSYTSHQGFFSYGELEKPERTAEDALKELKVIGVPGRAVYPT